jgi:hypothetical protein
MASTKSKFAIPADQIPHRFDHTCIENLARIGKLPRHANRQRFADSIREAARIYTTEIREPNDNEVHAEIKRLHRVAERRHFEELATLVEKLSSRARNLLKYDECLAVRLPEALRDHERRNEACATVVKLCQYGGGWTEGRKRPSGKRSWTWCPYLRAPKPQPHFPKREAELTFVMWIRTAWLEATCTEATLTTDPRRPGPFARMVQECLRLVGAAHADGIGLLNKLNEVRREMTQRPAVPPLSSSNT